MKAIRYSISSLRFWPAFGIHMRPYLLFVSGVAGLSGMALAADFTFWSFSALAAFLAFFLGYGFGQAFTDCFQVDTDRLSSPYRPLSQGIVSPKEVGIVAVCGLLLVSLVLISLNGWNAILCGFSVMGLATYTFFKRNFWFAGPFYNAWIVVLLPLMGFMGMSSQNMAWSSFSYLFPLLLLSFFSYAYFVLMGYLKDIRADRQAGYRTFSVVFGWNASVWVSDVFVLLSSAFMLSLSAGQLPALLIGLAGSAAAVWGQLFAHLTKNKREENATLPIAMSVRAFILWHLAVIVAYQPALWVVAITYFFLFELVLRARPMREQI